jgi:hypothetical protein
MCRPCPRGHLPTGSPRWERRSEQLIAKKAGAAEGTRKPPSPMPAALRKEKTTAGVSQTSGAVGWFPKAGAVVGTSGDRGGAKRNLGGERRMPERLPWDLPNTTSRNSLQPRDRGRTDRLRRRLMECGRRAPCSDRRLRVAVCFEHRRCGVSYDVGQLAVQAANDGSMRRGHIHREYA